MNLDELKSDWQSMDKPDSFEVDSESFKKMLSQFEQIQQKTKKENIVLTVLFFLTIAFLWGMFLLMGKHSWWVWSGLLIITAEMVIAGGFAWYRNTGKRWKQLRQESAQYLQLAISKLKYRRFLMLVIIPVYILLLIVAINFIYMDVISDLQLQWRLIIHFGISVALAGFTVAEIWRRYRRECREIDPIIEEFESLKKKLE
ncbi:hypothetical protein [Fodinibius saliphilus]|uniref:hypothetical protein n=1 Tax=Fodinibius saliphilus TaxID=1920650 RepID=UPI0014870965|nr:hypothetical protein [Fodinibius saliphilus]